MTGKLQTISLSREQYELLLKIVYLGNWLINAHRTEDIKKEYEQIEDYIFSLAPQFGFEEYLNHEESDGDRCFPTRFFEEETDVNALHDEYDDNTFWDELPERLGKRDFFEKFTEKEIKKMSREEWFKKLFDCIDVYNDEFATNGIERLRIDKH